MAASGVVPTAILASPIFVSAILVSAALAWVAFASAILASINFAASLAEKTGAVGFCVDGDVAVGGAAGFGVAGCAGTVRSGPPHMPQKRLVSGFEFPQRGQRTVFPPH
jgi:hypothetical protein